MAMGQAIEAIFHHSPEQHYEERGHSGPNARETIPLLLEIACRAPGERTHVHVQHHPPDVHRQPFFVHGLIFILRQFHNLRNFREVSALFEFGNYGCLQILNVFSGLDDIGLAAEGGIVYEM